MTAPVFAVSYTSFFLGAALVWVATGAALAVLMGRRGHAPFAWLLTGGLLGPLAVVLAIDAWRHGEDDAPRIMAVAQSRGPGPVHVLAGIDGSPECRAALQAAVTLLGNRMGRLTLASVIPYDGGPERERDARAALEAAAILLDRPAGLEILHGRPGPALLTRTILEGYDLLVVGRKGTGASAAVVGSTARELARSSRVPVLMTGTGDDSDVLDARAGATSTA